MRKKGEAQRALYPFIKEYIYIYMYMYIFWYTLNHNIKVPYCFKVYSLLKGSWALWGAEESVTGGTGLCSHQLLREPAAVLKGKTAPSR